MAALILTLILSFVIAGLLWFTLGSRIALAEDSSENDLANLVPDSYTHLTLPTICSL